MRQRQHWALHRMTKGAAPFAVAVVILTMPAPRQGYQPAADPLDPVARVERQRNPGPAFQCGEGGPGFRCARSGLQGGVGALAREPVAGEGHWAHLISSPFGTIHAATFSFPQPVGTVVPVSSASSSVVAPVPIAAPQAGEGRGAAGEGSWQREFPDINRGAKGPRLVPRVRPEFYLPQPPAIDKAAPSPGLHSVGPGTPPVAVAEEPTRERAEPTNATPPLDDAAAANLDPPVSADGEQWLAGGDDPTLRAARIYFGTAPLGGAPATMEPWGPGRAPIFEPPEPEMVPPANNPAPFAPPRNETIAPKGEVTGFEHRPKSPAERLGLVGAARAKHEKCLADAIYFEARGESVRGQMAVAQVVINRVFSGYYPNNICGVVYQNAHRRFRCQFTFACDGLPERINEPVAWERARHIARDALDGNFWLNDVGKATHYHARWVHPWWVREMRRLDRIGVHTFYRPRNWGDGSKSPIWGDADATAEAARTL